MESVIDQLNATLDRIKAAMEKLAQEVVDQIEAAANTAQPPTAVSNNIDGVPGDTPYNLVQQPSSHNSYNPATHDLPIAEQFSEYGIHSFELDIHSGDPGLNLVPFFDGDQRPDGDYYVYHFTGDSDSYNEFLSDGLDEIAGLNNDLPLTLFVDLKGSPFQHEGQGVEAFENLLEQHLGDKLFTPQDMIDRVPGANTLQQAIEIGGWPTVEELDGRVMVVLTGGDSELFDYASEGSAAAEQKAFIAPSPQITTGYEWAIDLGNGEIDLGPEGTFFHPSQEAIFYNMPEGDAHQAQIVHDNGYVSRIYGFDDLGENTQSTDANHLGTDHIDPENNAWQEENEEDPFNILEEPPASTPDSGDGEVF